MALQEQQGHDSHTRRKIVTDTYWQAVYQPPESIGNLLEIKGRRACFQTRVLYFGGIDLNDRKVCRQFPHGAKLVGNARIAQGMDGPVLPAPRFFQERKAEAIAIAARNLRTSNTDLIERQWQYAKSYMFEKIPYPTEKGFKLVFELLAPRVPKVSGLRFEDVCDTSFVKELVDKGFFK